ncbi:hypothetical protein Lal_00041517 [Lupinus albus]|uniref:Uncharacterized protein n=1 Tax=Lupinus albus TaxID=3870 RepID=A0A6A4PDP7_LUPAL|nr:hypothetical protein Lalb_Chr16g0389981 [Lupinus albus]KAF1874072.1 hypothetical protein Lal_00041517 [Lupinus albus]
MGQELKLDHNDKSLAGSSPNTVLSSDQYCSNAKKMSKKGKPIGKDEFFTIKGNYSEINFTRFRSTSCKSHLRRPHGLEMEGNIEMRRGSVYHSSEVVNNIKKLSSMGGREKIEISRTSGMDTSFSGSVVGSLCGSDDEEFGHRSSEISRHSNLGSPSVSRCRARMMPNSPNGFIDVCINSHVRDKSSTAVRGRDSTNIKFGSDIIAGSLIDANSLEKDTVHSLQKFSAKVDASHSQSPSESDCSSRANPKSRFNPIRKRLNQFVKSKSLRSPMSIMLETNKLKSNETMNITRNRTSQKSLLNNLSNAANHSEIISDFINREIQHSGIASSPVHLHGNLTLENRHGLPSFEFKVKCPEDVFVAKASRAGNAFNWIYTFQSIDNRKKSNASDLRSHHLDKDSSVAAQMLVSCKLCSKLESSAVDNNSMVTEFVLYDLTHSRRSVSSEKRSFCKQDSSKTLNSSCVGLKEETFRMDEENLAIKSKVQVKPLSSNVEFGQSDSYPLFSTELNSNLETAAIVLQIPFSKRESLKYKRGDRISAKEYSDIIERPTAIDRTRRKSLRDYKIQEQMKVVIPTGNHGLPTVESRGPSSLLDRLRHGGGCDCGGWDMACPLILLGNPSIQFSEDHPLMEEHQPLELYIQGAKDNSPTFSMKIVEEGQYAVDFHAQLSTLQAFSICVAILHGTSAFNGSGHEKKQQFTQCSSLKMLTEDEVELLIKSVTAEKKTVSKPQKRFPQFYVPNPPFSPIARV